MKAPLQKLELNWIGKGQEFQLEPRILLEQPELAAGDPLAENMLVHGDNLLALKALEQDFTGKVKCIYIDPPYNTGSAFKQYDDGVEHSLWLSLLTPRLKLLRTLLSNDGSIWISIDDNEVHYLKVLCDEVFGRENFKTSFIWRKVDSPNDNKVPIAPDHEYILCYTKNKAAFKPHRKADESILDAYKEDVETGLFYRDRLLKKNGKSSLRVDRPSMGFAIPTPDGGVVYPIHDDGREACWAAGKATVDKLIEKDELIWKKRMLLGKETWVPYTREYAPGDPTRPHPTIWADLATMRQAKAHQKALFPEVGAFDTPKPEELIERILGVCTDPGDWVLDSFLGSGTTAAVAHKMGRRWVGVELGDHARTHCLPRLRQVVAGTDQGGISKTVDWQGGGGFKFYTLAPSLLNKDQYDNWVISKEYNAQMLAAALAKQEGFRYQPDPHTYWKQARSSEHDFLFTTTQFVTVQTIDQLAAQLRPEESLLIACRSYQPKCAGHHPRITLKKIPQLLLGRCEFGRDDYSLHIVQVPSTPEAVEEETAEQAPAAEAAPVQGQLF